MYSVQGRTEANNFTIHKQPRTDYNVLTHLFKTGAAENFFEIKTLVQGAT